MKPRKTCQLRITNTSHALWHLGSFHQRTAPLSFPLKNNPHTTCHFPHKRAQWKQQRSLADALPHGAEYTSMSNGNEGGMTHRRSQETEKRILGVQHAQCL